MEGSCVPSTTLLNLGNVELEEAVQPCDEFLSVARTVVSLGRSEMAGWSRAGQEQGEGEVETETETETNTARQRGQVGAGEAVATDRDSPMVVLFTESRCDEAGEKRRSRRRRDETVGENGSRVRREDGQDGWDSPEKLFGDLGLTRVVGNQFHCLINTTP